MADDPISAMLDMLGAHADRLTRLDTQVGAIAGAAQQLTEFAALARHLDQRITVLGLRLDQASPPGAGEWPHLPASSRRWAELAGEDRDGAITGLMAWVDQVYRPGYGQFAATLGPCWHQHALCLYAIDILAELWTLLYQPGDRSPGTLTAQAEYQARIMPALAEQMAIETRRCPHRRDQHLPGGRELRRPP
jgi:hypothetical protein